MKRTFHRESDRIRAEIDDCVSEMEADREDKNSLKRRTTELLILISRYEESSRKKPRRRRVT